MKKKNKYKNYLTKDVITNITGFFEDRLFLLRREFDENKKELKRLSKKQRELKIEMNYFYCLLGKMWKDKK